MLFCVSLGALHRECRVALAGDSHVRTQQQRGFSSVDGDERRGQSCSVKPLTAALREQICLFRKYEFAIIARLLGILSQNCKIKLTIEFSFKRAHGYKIFL